MCGALGAYASYRVTNLGRHANGFHQEDARRAFQQALLEGSAGHPVATRALQTAARRTWRRTGSPAGPPEQHQAKKSDNAAEKKRPRLTITYS